MKAKNTNHFHITNERLKNAGENEMENDNDTNDYSGIRKALEKAQKIHEETEGLKKMKKTKAELSVLASKIAESRVVSEGRFIETRKLLMESTKEELISKILALTSLVFKEGK